MGPEDLRAALGGLPSFTDPNLLYGTNPGDDTGVYQLREDLAIVQTVDFFTPIVDDPYDFGQIAAANALSDCFTMGAKPVTGLNLVSYPRSLGMGPLREILRGGADKMGEAGAVIVGGHTVDDTEPKYGIAVTGIVDPRKMITNAGAKPGDALILTKKIGTGVVTTIRKRQNTSGKAKGQGSGPEIRDGVYEEAVGSMKTLNQRGAELMAEAGARACTDVTGFGLVGHAHNLALASGVGLQISFSAVPKFEGIEVLALSGLSGGGDRNRSWLNDKARLEKGVGQEEYALLCDAQTSGPLLFAIDASKAEGLVDQMCAAGVPAPAIIGRVLAGPVGQVTVTA